MLDTIIRNGNVVDGSGRPTAKADIAIKDGKIVSVGDLREAEAKNTLDATGLTVSPGFIDMHSHSDLSLLGHKRGESSLSQGITTEVIGSCGWSMAPVKEETRKSVLNGLITGLLRKDLIDTMDWSWHSFGEFMDVLGKAGIGVNVAPQIGQSLVRAHVVGTEKRDAAPGEIEAMKALVRQAMQDGAWGLSAGRSYRPGGHAPTEEMIELVKVVAEYEGVYANHMKNEGDGLFDAVEEVISIAEKTGAKVEISHHKAVGRKNFGKVHRSLEMIEGARRRGLRITVDTYPYEFSQASSLARVIPMEIWKTLRESAGSTPENKDAVPTAEEIETLLKDKAGTEKVKALPEVTSATGRFANFVIARSPSTPKMQGRILEDIAAETGKNVVDLMLELLLADGLDVWAASAISIDDVHTVIKADFAMGGTDAFNVDQPIYPTAIHPRHYGTFPRIVGRFVTQDHLYSLEEAVRKCTYNPARVMGIPDRGLVEAGYWADLVIFDSSRLMDTATGPEPYLKPTGIEYVLVNGKIALDKGTVKPVYAGQVLRRK